MVALLAGAMLTMATSAMATPTEWSSNGHWYELVAAPRTSWITANALANLSSWQDTSGHLATITSAEENAFVFSVVGEGWYWLGGHQAVATDVVDGWNWVNGETWNYTNWVSGEPNNLFYQGYGFENALILFGDGQWNDSPDGWNKYSNERNPGSYGGGYVVEYDTSPAPVPEPGTIALLGIGMLGLVVYGKRRQNKQA